MNTRKLDIPNKTLIDILESLLLAYGFTQDIEPTENEYPFYWVNAWKAVWGKKGEHDA